MKVKIIIECNNAAFDDGNLGKEVARILKRVQNDFIDLHDDKESFMLRLFDANGNRVGYVEFTEEE